MKLKRIRIQNANLSGPLPESMENLVNLEEFYIDNPYTNYQYNYLLGQYVNSVVNPNQVTKLPSNIGNWKKLRNI
ncbi:hypothetical protein H6769_06370 [Candidatus Peribacteria bacterium]|nr:hypothetical protein [Candidatus Peribacteria bacterium]